jgi:hypothetical protein
VTEVMVNGPVDVFVEREGRIERVPDRLFEGEEPVLHLIERIVGPLGLRVDGSSPWVRTDDCRTAREFIPDQLATLPWPQGQTNFLGTLLGRSYWRLGRLRS